ncbi:MFS transporter [Micromonospora endophytica]|uniref:MFS transporter n=1 Tax=Micromonospora endophytica TaxID=515350 RepID=UPI001BB3C70D|nr:MFS transporter [Micromonospora endophytica]BCJ61875.1 MFS transporter [Micromonospora endophytica]
MAVAAPPRATARQWWGLAVLTLPTAVIAISMTVLHLAVPKLSADLRPGSTQLLWIIDVYGFVIAGLLITMGNVGDRFGRRRLLTWGAAAFGAASAAAAFAPTAELLILARALMGATAATLMPSTMSLIRTMFTDARERSVAISVWISSFTAGSALGPVVGGALLERFWWGSVFLLAVPVAALVVVLSPVLLPEQRATDPGRLDLLGAGMLLAAVLALVYGLKQAAAGASTLFVVAVMLAGLVIGAVFVHRQRTGPDPLLDLRLFANRSFTVTLGVLALVIAAASGMQFFISQYLQTVVGLSPLQAGLVVVPAALASIGGTMLAPLLARRIPQPRLMAGGLVLAAAGLATLTQVTPESGATLVIAGGSLMSLGFGPTLALGNGLLLTTVPAAQAGAAAAISETGADLGIGLGIALIGSAGMAVYRAEVHDALPPEYLTMSSPRPQTP